MPECIFCKIAAGQIPATLVYEDDQVVAFDDLNPQAPTHLLIVPREHHASLALVPAGEELVLGKLLALTRELAAALGLDARGYRVVINTGPEAGQSVPHLHLHLLAGRPLGWPPG